MTPRERFIHDPKYHALVTMLEKMLEVSEFTHADIAHAAVIAATRNAMRHGTPTMIRILDEVTP